MTFKVITSPFRKGYEAGLLGQSLDSCRFLITDKRLSWVAGYQQGKLEKERTEANISGSDRNNSQDHISKLKKALNIHNEN